MGSGRAIVRGEEARHLRVVLRARPGRQYELSDGQQVWLAQISEIRADEVEFELLRPVDQVEVEPPIAVTLLLSVVRFARFEWALEKATELGVSGIQPIDAARSERGLVTAAPKRMDRWRKIAHESAQQSRRLRAPTLLPLQTAVEAFQSADAVVKLLLSERREATTIGKSRLSIQPSSVALAIGPEGGWTDAEFDAAGQAGFREVSLGPTILRTETSVVAALAVILCAWQQS